MYSRSEHHEAHVFGFAYNTLREFSGLLFAIHAHLGNGQGGLYPQQCKAKSAGSSSANKVIGGLFEKKDERRNFTIEQRRLIWHSEKNKKCAVCGETLTWNNFTIDHRKPHSRGGRTSLSNAQLMCRRHNSMKGAR